MKLTKEMLAEMAQTDIRTVDISELTDLRDIKIDTSQPVEKKLAAFAEQTKNIYVNRIGDYVVKVRFQESGATIDDKMAFIKLGARSSTDLSCHQININPVILQASFGDFSELF